MPVTTRGTQLAHSESVAGRLDELQALHDEGAELDALAPELRAAEQRLLGERAPIIRRVDARTAMHLLPHEGVASVWTRLLRLEAAVCRRAGLEVVADRIDDRASAIDEQVAFARDLRLRGVRQVHEGGGDFAGSTAGLTLADFRVLAPYAGVLYGIGGAALWRPQLALAGFALLLLSLAGDAAGEWRRAHGCAHQRGEPCGSRLRRRSYLLRGGGWLLVAAAAALTALRVQPLDVAGAALAGGAALLLAGFWRSPALPCARGDAPAPEPAATPAADRSFPAPAA